MILKNIGLSSATLRDLLVYVSATASIVQVEHVKLLDDNWRVREPISRCSNLTALSLNLKLSRAACKNLIEHQLPHYLQHLVDLRLSFVTQNEEPIDVTNSVIALFQHQKCRLHDFFLDAKLNLLALCDQVLKDNKTLHTIGFSSDSIFPDDLGPLVNVLLEHNTTLQFVQIPTSDARFKFLIKLLTKMNRTGRGRLRNGANVFMSEFLVALAAAAAPNHEIEDADSGVSALVLTTLYRLLQETVFLWQPIQKSCGHVFISRATPLRSKNWRLVNF